MPQVLARSTPVPDEEIDGLFAALADATRRDILRRSATGELSVSMLAAAYPMSFAAVQKHVAVLERAGLVSRVVTADKLMDEALGAALMICDYGQLSVMATKEAVNRAFESGLSDGLMFERRLFQSMFATSDQKEGMDAFLAKRKPVFTHR